MQYIKLTDDKFIEYNPATDRSRVIVKSDVEKQLQDATEHLSEMPGDEQLLEWARANYPNRVGIQRIEQRISELTLLLENLNGC